MAKSFYLYNLFENKWKLCCLRSRLSGKPAVFPELFSRPVYLKRDMLEQELGRKKSGTRVTKHPEILASRTTHTHTKRTRELALWFIPVRHCLHPKAECQFESWLLFVIWFPVTVPRKRAEERTRA